MFCDREELAHEVEEVEAVLARLNGCIKRQMVAEVLSRITGTASETLLETRDHVANILGAFETQTLLWIDRAEQANPSVRREVASALTLMLSAEDAARDAEHSAHNALSEARGYCPDRTPDEQERLEEHAAALHDLAAEADAAHRQMTYEAFDALRDMQSSQTIEQCAAIINRVL